jgi:hypothetical protein
MARTRKLIANYVSFDMPKTAMRINGMSDEELGKWFRKALIDLLSGCIDPNTDPFIKEQYDRSHAHMVQQQNHNSRIYQNRLARENDQENTHISTKGQPQNHRENDGIKGTPSDSPSVGPEDGNILELSPKAVKKPYGQNKFVLLTDEEGTKLRIAYKEDLELAISILDGYLENNPKARKKYKSHYSVLRRGGWVWNKVLEVKNNEQRLENTTKRNSNQSFKQMEIDKRTEFFTTSIADRMMNNG